MLDAEGLFGPEAHFVDVAVELHGFVDDAIGHLHADLVMILNELDHFSALPWATIMAVAIGLAEVDQGNDALVPLQVGLLLDGGDVVASVVVAVLLQFVGLVTDDDIRHGDCV